MPEQPNRELASCKTLGISCTILPLTHNTRHAVHRPPACLVPPLGLRSRRNGRRSKKILADGPGAAPDGGALDTLVESILVADYAPPDA